MRWLALTMALLVAFTTCVQPAQATSFAVLLGNGTDEDCDDGGTGWDITMIAAMTHAPLAIVIIVWLLVSQGDFYRSDSGATVCAPCDMILMGEEGIRIERLRVQQRSVQSGGASSTDEPAFALVDVPDSLDNDLKVSAVVRSCDESTSEERRFVLPTLPLPDPELLQDDLRAWRIPVLVEDDRGTDTAGGSDAAVSVVYAGGVGSYPAGSGVTAELTLYDTTTGEVLTGTRGEICNPCTLDANEEQRRIDFDLQQLIGAGGGFRSGPIEVSALLVLEGDTSAATAGAFVESADALHSGLLTSCEIPAYEVVPPATATAAEAAPSRVGLRLAPNPSGGATDISLVLARPQSIEVSLHDLRGRRVATLLDEVVGAGSHTVHWSGRDDHGARVASGVYFVRVARANGDVVAKKLVRAR